MTEPVLVDIAMARPRTEVDRAPFNAPFETQPLTAGLDRGQIARLIGARLEFRRVVAAVDGGTFSWLLSMPGRATI